MDFAVSAKGQAYRRDASPEDHTVPPVIEKLEVSSARSTSVRRRAFVA
jgi:hypothetical protein